jgi:hypothetical protein
MVKNTKRERAKSKVVEEPEYCTKKHLLKIVIAES